MKNSFFIVLVLFGFFVSNAQSQQNKEEKIRSIIYAAFDYNNAKCNNQISATSEVHGKIEFWRICDLKNNSRIIKIESHKANIYYQEIYFETNEGLVYAKETENYIPKNHFTQLAWSCNFYIANNKIISLQSLGHGKIENDTWNPEVIFKMYKNRLS